MREQRRQDLERVGYFYHRGAETTRLETFVDAAFAFALTLLVISFDAVPQTYNELVIALRAIPAFLFGFAILMMFWIAHRNWSNRFGLDTTITTLISLALVFVILVYVYPLRAMATGAVSAITQGWLPPNFSITNIGQLRGLFVIYGTGFVLCSLCIIGLYQHALSLRKRLQLTPEELFLSRSEISAWMITASVGLVSIVLAMLLPPNLIGFSGWVYVSLAVVMPVFGGIQSRRFDKLFGATGSD